MDTAPVGPLLCASCGAAVADGARFCAQCGGRLDAEARAAPPAPPATAAAASSPQAAAADEDADGGWLASLARLALSFAALGLAIFLLVSAAWAVGGVLLAVALGLVADLFSAGGRRTLARATRAAADAADQTRGHVGLARVSVASWSRAGREAVPLRAEQRRRRRRHAVLMRSLGEAVFGADEEHAALVREEAKENQARVEELEQQLRLALDTARSRVGRERMALRATRVVAGAGEPERGGSPMA